MLPMGGRQKILQGRGRSAAVPRWSQSLYESMIYSQTFIKPLALQVSIGA